MDALRCDGLTKRYRRRTVVDGLDLAVSEGEVFGFLGPNGAGKTTTLRMLLGLVRPSAGRAFVLGEPVPCPGRLGEVGAMVEEPAFYPWASGRENLRVLADTGPPGTGAADVGAVLERVGLGEAADRRVRTYSQGMRQRLGLAVALLRRPRLLLLDEPANGLDPAGLREFRVLLRELGDAGTTVFLSSHLLGEIELVCDRVAVIRCGRLVALGPVAEVGASISRVRVRVAPAEAARAAELLRDLGAAARGAGEFDVRAGTGRAVNAALVAGGVVADSVEVVRTGLEERFLSMTEPGEGTHATAAG